MTQRQLNAELWREKRKFLGLRSIRMDAMHKRTRVKRRDAIKRKIGRPRKIIDPVERTLAWNKANPDKYANLKRRNNLRRYGLTPEKFEELFEAQKGICPICLTLMEYGTTSRHSKRSQKAVVDHCHKTGIVRGILHHRCNSAEGLVGSVSNARRLLAYMERNELFYA